MVVGTKAASVTLSPLAVPFQSCGALNMKYPVIRGITTMVVMLCTAGCVLPPAGGYTAPYVTAQNGYAPGYGQPVYPTPGYPPTGYAAPAYGDEQYTYIDGVPYAVYGGQQEVVIFDSGLGWGFYDPAHHWHRAPDRWRDEFEHRYPGGRGYAPPAREFGGRPGFAPQGRPPEPGYRPGAYEPPAGRPPERGPERGPEPGFRPGNPPPPGRPPGPPPGPPQGRAFEGGNPPPAQRQQAAQPQRPPPPPPAQHGGSPACGQPGAPKC